MDVQNTRVNASVGNTRSLVVIEKASKLPFASPMPSKEALRLARKLLDLMLPFGVPMSVY